MKTAAFGEYTDAFHEHYIAQQMENWAISEWLIICCVKYWGLVPECKERNVNPLNHIVYVVLSTWKS